MDIKKVVTKGGRHTVYKVSSHSGTYYIYILEGVFGRETKIGETRSFDDALSLIRSYSGSDIDKIGPW